MEIRGRGFILTGAGSGIGRATAVALGREGARITLVGRQREPLETTAGLVVAAGGEAIAFPADVAVRRWHRDVVGATLTQFGSLHCLINNAGNVRAGRLESMPEADILTQIDVNLTAPIFLTRAALPHLKSSGDAMIVNIASGIALIGIPFYSVYAAAKAGLARFGESLHRELQGEGVSVMTVYPGATDTPMMETNRAGPELGFTRESPGDVAGAIVAGILSGAREVIRGGEKRIAMIATNRERPSELDARFAGIKPELEAAVSDHRRI
jgi:short-subunit dehydrogenase